MWHGDGRGLAGLLQSLCAHTMGVRLGVRFGAGVVLEDLVNGRVSVAVGHIAGDERLGGGPKTCGRWCVRAAGLLFN